MLIRKIFLLMLLMVINFAVFAQSKGEYSSGKKKAIALFEESELYLIRGQFPQAIQLLQQAIEKDDEFAEAHLRLGSLYKDVGSIDKAIYHLSKAVGILPNDKRTAGAYYSLANIYFQSSQYEKANTLIDKFLDTPSIDRRIVGEAMHLKNNIQFAQEAIKNPLPFKPVPLAAPLNRFQLQYFPVLTADNDAIIYTRREGAAQQYDEDIVISRKDSQGKWREPESISPFINSEDNEGTTAISADGRMLIFTSCLGRKGYGSCDLFVSYKTGEVWSEPENLGPGVNGPSWESQPSLSADGRILYFISDRTGGMGKRDVWASNYDGNTWSKAANLGPKINTSFDEVSPFIHANGLSLYFASKGHAGFGGYDLFIAELTEVGWTNPQNLGYPLNNSADQVSLFITADGKEGYYSYEENYRTQYYKSLLYTFQVPEEIQVENKSNYVKGKVYDKETKKPLKARIELFNIVQDQLKGSVSSDSVSGEYLIVLNQGSEYALHVSKPGYLFESLAFDYSAEENPKPIVIDVFLSPVKKGVKTTLNNIFFASDEYTLQEKSKTELKKVVQFIEANPEVMVNISGHTDDVGSESYNKSLSLNRAKAVFDFLVQKGVDKKRLQYGGFGEASPLVPNNSEENRQLNRRIEIEIL